MREPGVFIASVSNCMKAVTPDHLHPREMNAQINKAMRNLYREGYRRLRVVPLPKNGDSDRCKVMGWFK